jgi:pimeloyl-ACP methyl ester carboxylesterase
MGVNVALEFYARHERRVAALALIAGCATFPASSRAELERLRAAQSVLKLIDGVFPRLVDEFWRLQGNAPGASQIASLVGFNRNLSKPEDIKKVVEMMSGLSPKVFFQLLGEYIRHDRRETASNVSVPSLVIAGSQDMMVPPRFCEELHRQLGGSRYVAIEGGSHCPQFDRPHEVNAHLGLFLESLFVQPREDLFVEL